jgi:hypothetical protein
MIFTARFARAAEDAERVIFLFSVDPPRKLADRKDGKQITSTLRLKLRADV